jgi:hypothetical protein
MEKEVKEDTNYLNFMLCKDQFVNFEDQINERMKMSKVWGSASH